MNKHQGVFTLSKFLPIDLRRFAAISLTVLSLVTIAGAANPATRQQVGSQASPYARFVKRAQLNGLEDWQQVVTYSPDGSLLATEAATVVNVFNTRSGDIVATYNNVRHGLAFSPDGTRLAIALNNNTVTLYDSHTGQEAGSIPIGGAFVFSRDGSLIAGVGKAQTITVYNAQTGVALNSFPSNSQRVYAMSFSPDGQTLATANIDATVRLFDSHTGRQESILEGHTDRVYRVEFSPDGLTLASCGNENNARIWNVSTGQTVNVLQGHIRGVNAIAFSPNGAVIATGSKDYSVRLWNAVTGAPIATLPTRSASVLSLAFSPDGAVLAVAQWGVTLWAAPETAVLSGNAAPLADTSVGTTPAGGNQGSPAPVKPGRDYYLLGPKHLFRIGSNPDLHLAERKWRLKRRTWTGSPGMRSPTKTALTPVQTPRKRLTFVMPMSTPSLPQGMKVWALCLRSETTCEPVIQSSTTST